MTYGKFLKHHIFNPLGMSNSLVYDESKPVILNRAYGYTPSKSGYRCDDICVYTTGDGCVFSTIDDLYLWTKALDSDMLVGRDSLKAAFTSGKSTDGSELGYGFGWEIKISNGIRRIYHTGLDGGFRNMITRFSDEGLTVILLSNNGGFSYQKRLDITNYFYEKFCR